MVLKIDYDTVKLPVTYNVDVIKITLPKVHHQNDVTKFFHFQAPPLAQSWLRFWCRRLVGVQLSPFWR